MISCPKDSSWFSKKELTKWILRNSCRIIEDSWKAHTLNLLSNTKIFVIPAHANTGCLMRVEGQYRQTRANNTVGDLLQVVVNVLKGNGLFHLKSVIFLIGFYT